MGSLGWGRRIVGWGLRGVSWRAGHRSQSGCKTLRLWSAVIGNVRVKGK